MPTEVVAAVAIGVGTAAYSKHEADNREDKAKKDAEKARQAQEQRELEAGEYWQEVNRQQMELQSQSSTIKTLANILTSDEFAPKQELINLPAPVQEKPINRINRAIDDILRGVYG